MGRDVCSKKYVKRYKRLSIHCWVLKKALKNCRMMKHFVMFMYFMINRRISTYLTEKLFSVFISLNNEDKTFETRILKDFSENKSLLVKISQY